MTSLSDEIDRQLLSVHVKKLVDSGMLTSSNANEMQEVCEKLMIDEITLKSFVQHREFLALKAQKREAERNTLPDICLLYTSPSPRDGLLSRMPSSA